MLTIDSNSSQNAEPHSKEHGTEQMIGGQQWDRNAEAYKAYFSDSDKRVSSTILFPRILQLAGSLAGKAILDYGCGQGRFAHRFAELGAKVTAFDIAPAELEIAKSLYRSGNIQFVSDADALVPNQYDLILLFMVLLCNPVPDATELVAKVYSLCRPGGRVFLANTYTGTLGRRFPDFFAEPPQEPVLGKTYSSTIPTSQGEITVVDYFYSPADLRGLFQGAGFQVKAEEIIADQFVLHMLEK